MIPTFAFLAIPLALMYLIGTVIDLVTDRRDRRMLHAIFDGDRLQHERAERNQKIKMNHERRYC